MTVTTPNLLYLAARCELYYNGKNVFVPMARCATKELADVLDRFDTIDIAVEFRASTDEKVRARELAAYTKRMRSLPAYYHFTGFQPKILDGFTQSTMTGRLTRCI